MISAKMYNVAPIHNGLQFGHLLFVFPEKWELRFKPLQEKGTEFQKTSECTTTQILRKRENSIVILSFSLC